jgi:hypothetical protein
LLSSRAFNGLDRVRAKEFTPVATLSQRIADEADVNLDFLRQHSMSKRQHEQKQRELC